MSRNAGRWYPVEDLDVEPTDPWWSCDRMKRVQAHTATDAARVFADRLARRAFGNKSGVCGACREDLRTENGNWYRFSIFIGRRMRDGGISGHNEWIEVERIR